MGVIIRISGQEKFAILAAEMRGPAQKAMRVALNKQLRVAVAPAVQEAKTAVRSLRIKSTRGGGRRQRMTKHGRHRGLRASIATGIRVKVGYGGRPSIVIVVTPNLPADQQKLPRDTNRPGGWRHPVFGNRHAWVQQFGTNWFEPAILKHRNTIVTELTKALDDTARQIASRVGGSR